MKMIAGAITGLAVVLTFSVAQAQPTVTVASLRDAALAPSDLPAGFQVTTERPSENPVSFSRSMSRSSPNAESVSATLAVSALTPSLSAAAFVLGARSSSSSRGLDFGTEQPLARFGGDAVFYTIVGLVGGQLVTGAVVSWREGPVVATTFLLTTTAGDAGVAARALVDYPDKQRAKLAAALGQPSPAAPVIADQRTLPYIDVLTCASFATLEAAQALLAAYPDDPYKLDDDGNGIACEDLPRQTDGDIVPVSRRASMPVPVTTLPVSVPTTPPGILFEASGTGDSQTDNFISSSRVQMCWELSGSSGTFGPQASFYIYPQGTSGGSFVADFALREDSGCSFANIPTGTFYIEVNATSWTRWRVTIKAAP